MYLKNPAALIQVQFVSLVLIWKVRAGKMPTNVINVALNKPSWMQSRDIRNGIASRANDGNNSTVRSWCAHSHISNESPHQWWRVDLLAVYKIWYIRITPVGDSYPYSLTDFELRVSSSMKKPNDPKQDDDKLCYYQEYGMGPGISKNIDCDNAPVEGRFVTLLSPRTVKAKQKILLFLCEVAVYAEPVEAIGKAKGDLKAGASCLGKYFSCKAGLICDQDSICRGALDSACDGQTACKLNTTCSKGKCALGKQTVCDEYPTKCAEGLICDTARHCRLEANASCAHNMECASGMVCTNKTCQCSKGLTQKNATCPPADGKVGGKCGSCTDPKAECKSGVCMCKKGYTMNKEDYSCGVAEGQQCTSNSDCVQGSVCDMGNKCKLEAGESCHGRKKFHCKFGTVCDVDEICRINGLGACKKNAATPAEDGKLCRLDLYCDFEGHCRIPSGGPCWKPDADVCSVSTECRDGKCQCPKKISHPWDPNLQICDHYDMLLGSKCSFDERCVNKFDCTNDGQCDCPGRTRKTAIYRRYDMNICAYPFDKCFTYCRWCSTCDDNGKGLVSGKCHYDLGCECQEKYKDRCATGAICDVDHFCRLKTGGDCKGKEHLCARNAICDYFNKTCKLQVGADCSGNTAQCAGVAVCTNGVCTCPEPYQYGTTCMLEMGVLYGPCVRDFHNCSNKEYTECQDGICRCKKGKDCSGFEDPDDPGGGGDDGTDDDDSSNKSDDKKPERKKSGGGLSAVAVVMIVLGFLLLLVIIAIIVWKMRSKKTEPDAKPQVEGVDGQTPSNTQQAPDTDGVDGVDGQTPSSTQQAPETEGDLEIKTSSSQPLETAPASDVDIAQPYIPSGSETP